MNVPVEHFMREDLLGVGLATILFAALLVPPGYFFGWLFDVLEFRRQSWPWQVLTSLLLSVSMVPIVDYLLWSNLSIRAVWIFYSACAVFFLVFSFRARWRPIPRWIVCALLIWLLVACLSGIDLQFENRLYPSVITYDLNLRTALVDGIARDGLPARNPLFYPGQAQPLRYHYFWLIPCALVDLLGGKWVNARHALLASNVWCGWALMALVGLYLRYFHPAGERNIAKRAKWGIVILAVAGLDIVPNLFMDIVYALTRSGTVYASSEWWSTPVMGLPHAVLWVAHHVTATIACLTGFLLLWDGTRKDSSRAWGASVCAGLCFASAAGLSIYIAFTFGIFLAIWGVRVLVRGGWPRRFAWVAAAIVAGISAWPYLHSLGHAGGPAGNFAMFAVRSFSFGDLVLDTFGLSATQISWANFVALPLNYFMETGAWFILAVIWFRRAYRRRRRLGEAELAALTMFAVSFTVATFLRSGVIANNDLGWRSTLIGQLILIVWSVAPLRAWWRLRRWHSKPLLVWHQRLKVLLALGLASSLYEVAILRFYFPLTGAGAVPQVEWLGYDAEPGRRTFDARQVYEQLGLLLPREAVLQANPDHWDDLYHGLYGMRQTASFDAACGSAFGGNGDCNRMQAQLLPLFKKPVAGQDSDIDEICKTWGIDALIVKDDDPVFKDRSAWPWKRPPLAGNERVRAVSCGSPASARAPALNPR